MEGYVVMIRETYKNDPGFTLVRVVLTIDEAVSYAYKLSADYHYDYCNICEIGCYPNAENKEKICDRIRSFGEIWHTYYENTFFARIVKIDKDGKYDFKNIKRFDREPNFCFCNNDLCECIETFI